MPFTNHHSPAFSSPSLNRYAPHPGRVHESPSEVQSAFSLGVTLSRSSATASDVRCGRRTPLASWGPPDMSTICQGAGVGAPLDALEVELGFLLLQGEPEDWEVISPRAEVRTGSAAALGRRGWRYCRANGPAEQGKGWRQCADQSSSPSPTLEAQARRVLTSRLKAYLIF